MIFSVDVRRARKGDCLLLHFGTRESPGLIAIDGGPSGVYEPHLKPRLEAIRDARVQSDLLGEGVPLPVDVLMVSHVDDDHIRGILDLTREEIDADQAHEPRFLNVLDLWHNSFDAIIGNDARELTASVTAQFGAAAAAGELSDDERAAVEEESSEHPEVVRSGLAVLASIEQGFRLRNDAERLGYPINAAFEGDLILARDRGDPVTVGDLSFTVLGPMRAELVELQKKHREWLRKLRREGKSPSAALAAYVDKSVANLSSLVLLVEVRGKKVLLTGDARGDKILEGLELLGLFNGDGVLEVDVLKVPHHGSANNLEVGFFRRVVARHYVFSGDGEHGNPEREAFEMLLQARKAAPFVAHLTYPVDEIDAEREKDWNKERRKEQAKMQTRPKTKVRPAWSPQENGLAALFERLRPEQRLVVVDEQRPHVIDLLDPLGF